MSLIPRCLFFTVLLTVLSQSVTISQDAALVASRQDWIPQDAVVAIDLARPKELLELLASDEAISFITALPVYKAQVTKPKFQEFISLIRFMELTLGADWRTAIGKLTGGGISIAVCPEETFMLIVDAKDGNMLERLHETLVNITRSEAEKKNQPDPVESKQYGDVTAWSFDGKEAHAIIGKRFIMSNKPEGLKAVLDLRSRAGGRSLSSKPTYKAVESKIKSGAFATIFADLQILKQVPDIVELLKEQSENPLAALFFTGIAEAIRDSNWLALEFHIKEQTLTCRALVDGIPATQTNPAAFAFPKKKSEGVLPNLAVPRRIAAMTLYRDLYQFYAAKDELFPERTSGLIFFENMMGIFFTGRDLTNEVLAQTRPEIRLVVAEQEFDPSIGTPSVQLPAFALVLRLRNEEEFDEIAEEAWQKAIGLVNFTRGQQALPGLIIDRPSYANTKMTVCSFSTTDVEDKTNLPQRFNVRPTLAKPGDFLILSSTDGLARDLIDAVNNETKGQIRPLSQIHSLVEIEGNQLASILKANRDTLVRGDMVKKGRTKDESEAGIDLLISISKICKQIKFSVGLNEQSTEANLKIDLNLK